MAPITYEEARTRAERLVDERVKERVINGMELLKEKLGEEWVDRIDCASLDLRHGDSCILGQLYGGYHYGVEELFDGDDEQAELDNGFCVYEQLMPEMEGPRASSDTAWNTLDEAWHTVLACE